MNGCRSGRGPGGRIVKAPRFNLDLFVSGLHITALDDGTELGPIKPRLARTQACTRLRYKFITHGGPGPLGKPIRGRPSSLVGLRPVSVRVSGDHFTRVGGIVALAPCDAADPGPNHVIRVSRFGLTRFGSCAQVGWTQVYCPASPCVQYRKKLALISLSV